MPSCYSLTYNSNDLHPLTHFYLPPLSRLDVKSGQWNTWRGNHQLAALNIPYSYSGAQRLTDLQLDVTCSEQLLIYMLRLVPAFQLLSLGLASPNALSIAFFQAFIVREPNVDNSSNMVRPPSQTTAPSCPSLRPLWLRYIQAEVAEGAKQEGTHRSHGFQRNVSHSNSG